MEARHAQLKKYYDGGAIGLTRDGLVEVRDQNLVPLPERNAARKLVADENADRANLYREIARPTVIPNGRPTSARRSPSAGSARPRRAGTTRTRAAPGSKSDPHRAWSQAKKSPAFAGLFVSESATLRVVRLRRLNLETLLVAQALLDSHAPGLQSGPRRRIPDALCFSCSPCGAIPASLPRPVVAIGGAG